MHSIDLNKKRTVHHTDLSLLPVITGFFVAVLLISNIASSKLVQLASFTFDGGTLLFPLTYIFSDIFTEVYGFRIARRTIWIGLICQLAAMGVFMVVGLLPAPAEWQNQIAYSQILTTTFRIIIASSVAYFFGSWSNDLLMSILKRKTGGRYLWTRTIGSTLIGEGIDTVIFCLIAFGGVFSNSLLLSIIISNYIFKCGIEVLATPVTYLTCKKIKSIEGIDVIDHHKDYSPFSWKIATISS